MARRYYNGTVRDYNIGIQTFPDMLMAGLLGFSEEPFFQIEDRPRRATPTVAFSGAQAHEVATSCCRPVAAACGAAPRAAARSASCASSATSRSQRNGDLHVTETIRDAGRRPQIRRGILRDFPTIYSRTDGTRVEVGFDVRSVTRDGASEEFAPSGWRTACACASAAPVAHQHRQPHLRHPLPHHAADRLLRRLRRALLERHRQRLDFPDRRGRGAHHAAGAVCSSSGPRSTPARKARRGKDAARRADSPATSCSAPPSRCRSATA